MRLTWPDITWADLPGADLAGLNETILSWILVYGVIILFVSVMLAAIGLPFPSSFLILAAGAFIRQEMLDLPSALAWTLLGVVIGDCISYGVGRVARRPILRRFGEDGAWRNAERYLQQRGAIAIYFTRWLLTALAVPTNLVAGSGGYPFRRFLLVGAAGELTWLLLYGALGYVFSNQWETISELISNFGGLLLGALLLTLGIMVLLRNMRRLGPKSNPEPPSG